MKPLGFLMYITASYAVPIGAVILGISIVSFLILKSTVKERDESEYNKEKAYKLNDEEIEKKINRSEKCIYIGGLIILIGKITNTILLNAENKYTFGGKILTIVTVIFLIFSFIMSLCKKKKISNISYILGVIGMIITYGIYFLTKS